MPTLSDREVRSELDDRMQNFVRRQEMLFVATGEPEDGRDCTFVTGGAGFVRVLSVNRLAWPEFDNASLSDAISDIERDPRVSLLFVDFARGAIGLHVNGKAKILDDDADAARLPRAQPRPDPGPGRGSPPVPLDHRLRGVGLHLGCRGAASFWRFGVSGVVPGLAGLAVFLVGTSGASCAIRSR